MGHLVGTEDWAQHLMDIGLLPRGLDVRRIIIDMACNETVKIYYETFGQTEVLGRLDWPQLAGAEVVHATKDPPEGWAEIRPPAEASG